jgi:hypothetical protein
MERVDEASPALKVLVWMGVVVASGVAGLIVVGVAYDEFMDCSNPEIHQSADTAFGWVVAFAASVLPVAVAAWLSGGLRRRLPAVAIAVALLSLVAWSWVLKADCEWYPAAMPAEAVFLL